MDGTKGEYYSDRLMWSPDSRKLATVKVRDAQVRRIPLLESHPGTQVQPVLQWRDYAKPGDVLPVSLPVLFDWSTRKQIPLDTDLYTRQYELYLTGWRADSRAFTFEFNQRGHQRYIVGEVNALDGKITHLVDERSSTFIYYYQCYRHDLKDGEEMLWLSERDGWRHLYLFGNDGQVKRQLTKGEWVVRNVDFVDEANGVIYFNASKSYPVVEMIYAGPHDSHVEKYFRATDHLCSRLVELGFIVVKIDGMGTYNRSKAFHDVCWKNLKDAGFPDRIAWIKAAAKQYPYMDINRVGIYGWSAGGQNAMAALLFHNDFYKVAVSLCGCHDNRMDKIWWNEQWMGYPIDESYSASSNVDNAWRLKGKLLLINGELDDNVDPASTLQVVSELMKANKNFDQLYLPGKSHSLGGAFEMHKIHDFFVENLLGQKVPEW